ncbi:Haloacetate dehalogenase H-1 [Defluviimonas aquaemixtae]|uniref:Haloacetate dehalogenase H-1 n=1 Tax=Albidovulum aquaemixtae TaxID=1542388 RepID=A0A2R8B4C0_9RHOB|nr:alpha/beta hydrolase [Defluviimonas aquaemixtae]SPH17437.1 Haloacetate dehalogenase H-1 [Defluviimonas aquaemixtae]
MEGFTDSVAEVNGQRIAHSIGGAGPAVLLLHGFPQTRAMWRQVAPRLAEHFTVVTADLRGYGASSKPRGAEHYSFREMGRDQLALMTGLGFDRFHLVGHDRGGRTAHRIALDEPSRLLSLTVMDIVPTHHLFANLSREVAASYYHWFFLAQPQPFPETLILADPDYFFESCLLGWGGAKLSDFDAGQLAAYREAWRDPATVGAMCDDYRAALRIDFDLDAADLGCRVDAPSLVLYGDTGAMARAYDVPATWADRLSAMQAAAVPGGHFFIDTNPDATAAALLGFLMSDRAQSIGGMP